MNWLFIVLVLYLIAVIIFSYIKGFAKMLLSIISSLVVIVVVTILTPAVKNIIINNTNLRDRLAVKFEEGLKNTFEGVATDDNLKTLEEAIEEIKLPKAVTDVLEKKASELKDKALEDASKSIGQTMAELVIYIGVYIVLFILLSIGVFILGKVLDLATKLPVVHQLNGIAGVVLGLLGAAINIYIVGLIISLTANTEFGKYMLKLIEDNVILSYIYNHNILLVLIHTVLKV